MLYEYKVVNIVENINLDIIMLQNNINGLQPT